MVSEVKPRKICKTVFSSRQKHTQKMADIWAMTKAINQAVIEAVKAMVQAMAGTGADAGAGPRSMAMNMGPRLGIPSFKQPSLKWSTKDKYAELRNFRLQVNKVFKTYDKSNVDKVPIRKN